MSYRELLEVKAIIARKLARGEIRVERSHPKVAGALKRRGLSMTKAAVYVRRRRARLVAAGLTVLGQPRRRRANGSV